MSKLAIVAALEPGPASRCAATARSCRPTLRHPRPAAWTEATAVWSATWSSGRAGWYGQWLSNELYYLNQTGRAHKAKFSGAGPNALLLTSTKGYASSTVPMVLFKAGSHSIEIEGSSGGQGEPASVYRLWKRLAHAIFAKLG